MMGADTDSDWRAFFPRSLRVFPADLTATVVLSVLMVVTALVPGLRETVVRVALALLIALFVPGYAFVAALFPESGPNSESDDGDAGDDRGKRQSLSTRSGGIDGMERVALSFGTSIAIVPLVGLVLNVTPWGLRLVPILVAISGFTLVVAYVGAQRRAELDPEDRFRVPYERWVSTARAELFETDTRRGTALTVVMVVSLLLAVGSVSYVVAFPKQGESFSEFYLLTENETGELVADDYPTEFVAGEPQPMVVGVENQEHEATTYTVITELQRVRVENNSTQVLESESLHRFSPTVEDNETWHRTHQVTPTMTGERLRLTYLLYLDSPPQNPTTENAYRELHLWVNVTSPTNQTNANVERPSSRLH